MKTLLLQLTILLATFASAHAQVEVSMDLGGRRSFLRGEPIEAKVTIRNLSGHDIILRDDKAHQWFGFEIIGRGGIPVAPLNPDYKNQPVPLNSGQSISRTVDLLRLYPANELGAYKIRATVFFDETGKYYTSEQSPLDVSQGKTVWTQTVGVPAGREGAGSLREFALVSFQTNKELTLYGRVTDDDSGTILATYPLGRILAGAKPMIEFNDNNTLFSFHMTGPNVYALTKIGVNGEWLGQTLWNAPKGRATVRRNKAGEMVVVGALPETKGLAGEAAPVVPKLSDAPPVSVPTR